MLELGVNAPDENTRASDLIDLLSVFFAHPSVRGVVFWGFWDGKIWETDATL